MPVRRFFVLSMLWIAPLLWGPTRLAAQVDACEEPGARAVRTLRFNGNATFPSDELSGRILTTPMSFWSRVPVVGGLVTKRCLDERQLQIDALRLVYFYRVRGFVDVTVDTIVRSVGTRRVAVEFAIVEGVPVTITEFQVTGLDSVPERAKIVRDLPVTQGGRFDEVAITAARDTITRRLRNAGYPRADVLRNFSTDRVQHTARVALAVAPGVQARIGTVVVEVEPSAGATPKISTDAVRGLLGIQPGALYREQDLVVAQRRVYQTEAFRSVRVDMDTAGIAGDSLVNLRVRVAENQLRAATLSVGWGTIECFRAQGALTHYNFLGGVRRLDLTGRVSRVGVGAPTTFKGAASSLCAGDAYADQYGDTLNYYVGATLRQPSFFGLRTLPSITIYSETRSEYNAYRRETPVGLNLALNGLSLVGQPIQVGYTMEYGRTAASPALYCVVFALCNPEDRAIASDLRRFAALNLSTEWSRVNDPLNATRGVNVHLEWRHASKLVGAEPQFRFNRLISDVSAYTRVVGGGVLAMRVRAGGIFDVASLAQGEQRFIPVQERLFAGGPSSVRGFRPNELGPASYRVLRYDTVTTNGVQRLEATPGRTNQIVVPVGGTAMLVGNIEYRVRSPFLSNIAQVALFTDVGQVWNRGTDSLNLGIGAFRWTPGVGLRVVTAFGAIRLDVGYNGYRAVSGPAYYDTPLEGNGVGGELLCVSPGNTISVPPPALTPTCIPTYQPLRGTSFWTRLTPSISIGQIF